MRFGDYYSCKVRLKDGTIGFVGDHGNDYRTNYGIYIKHGTSDKYIKTYMDEMVGEIEEVLEFGEYCNKLLLK